MMQVYGLFPNTSTTLDGVSCLLVNAIKICGSDLELPIPIILKEGDRLVLEYKSGGTLVSLDCKQEQQ